MSTVCLHLGAHKTGSTHFQHCLKHASHEKGCPFRLLLPADLRRWWNSGRQLHSNQQRDDFFAKVSSENSHIVLSEENIIGESGHIFGHRRLYEDLPNRLSQLKPLISDGSSIHVLFAIRNLANFLPSIYLEALRWVPSYRSFCEVYGGHWDQSWVNVINDVRLVFPSAHIAIAPFEHYPRIAKDMLSFFELSPELPAQVINTQVRPSPKLLAIRTFKAVNYLVPKRYQSGLFNQLANLFQRTSGQFQPLSEAQREFFTDQYLKDLEALRNLPEVSIIGATTT